MIAQASRGEIWLVDLDPVRDHEQAGRRPALVVSVDAFNHGPADLVVILPITSKQKKVPIPTHVPLFPPEGGVSIESFIKCEDIRSVARSRLLEKWQAVTPQTMAEVEDRLRILIDL